MSFIGLELVEHYVGIDFDVAKIKILLKTYFLHSK